MLLEERAHSGAAEKRNQRNGKIGERIVVDEGVAHALAQFRNIPFHGDAGRDDASHAGAGNVIERHAGFFQGFQHTDVGKAACAAAREHNVDGIAGDEARQSLDVRNVAHAHVMMGAEEIASELDVLRQAGPSAAGMQQQQLGLSAHFAIEETALERMERQFFVGARDQQHAVRLAQAEARPGAVRLVTLIEDHVVFGFEAIEPFRGFVAGRGIEDSRFGAHLDQRFGNAARDHRIFQPALERNDGEGFGTRLQIGAPRGLPQPAHDELQEIEHDARIARQQHIERLGAKPQ